MNILVIGSGGREHALCWKIAQSPLCKKLFCAPGNPGTASLAKNVAIPVTDLAALADFAEDNAIDLTVVGPDDPLAAGIVDYFELRRLTVFGPAQEAAAIEASKAFAKEVMVEMNIPCAKSGTFSDYKKAIAYVEKEGAPIVIKASGLALGKGVTVCQTLDEAKKALDDAMKKKVFGAAGETVVIEEFLTGPEFGGHYLISGDAYISFPPSQDHKRIGEGDTGPNTGGMGTIMPLPFVTEAIERTIEKTIVEPVIAYFKKKGTPFYGLLYPGMKLTAEGPKVFEYNARFGDPECQMYMRMIKSDIVPFLLASAKKESFQENIEWEKGAAVNLVLASDGYPGAYEKGIEISGIEDAEARDGIVVFHAGTKDEQGTLVTSGGRVLGVSATGATLRSALASAYNAADHIQFEGKYLRTDLGRSLF